MARQVYALWYGGYGRYAAPSVDSDLEVFDSVEDAAIECDNRYRTGDHFKCDVRPVGARPYIAYFPDVGTDSGMHVFLEDPRDATDPYPDYIIEYDSDLDEFTVQPA